MKRAMAPWISSVTMKTRWSRLTATGIFRAATCTTKPSRSGHRSTKIPSRTRARRPRSARPHGDPHGRDGVSLGRTGPEDVSVAGRNRLRGKHAVTLNLKQPGAHEVFGDLVRQADI